MSDFHFSPRPNRAHEIHWREWSEETFAEAQKEDKPILLGISAVWCHWCHVMDETSYSDPEVIQLTNERFVPIRVDNDQRPDVNRRYNLGGWPTTAFLTPTGELLTGGTYIPPAQMRGYLQQVSETYKNSKQEILRKVHEVAASREAALTARPTASEKLSTEIVDNVLQAILGNFDALYGGFGDEPKFPHTDAIELALEKYFQTHDESLLPVVTITLSKMASGGIYDHEAGGFFRYSTTRDWSVPHFEKMLEDNAKLLAVYVHAFQVADSPAGPRGATSGGVTRRDLFLKTIQSLTAYVDSALCDRARGGFYGSQDADEHYYALSLAERAKLPAPHVDHTFYTDWNALMVSAYLQASPLFPHPPLPSPRSEKGERAQGAWGEVFALKTLERLWNEMYRAGVGLHHYRKVADPAVPRGATPSGENDAPQLPGQLTDLAYTAHALLDAYQATGEPTYLGRAQTLIDIALATLYDPERGGFWSEPRGKETLGLLRVPDKSLNENAAMARALTRLYRLTETEKYRAAAEKTLAYFASDYERYSFTAADYARAVDQLLNEPLRIHIVGTASDARTRQLHAAALNAYAPAKLVQLLDPARDAARLARLGYPADGTPQAYVCVGQTCLPPVRDSQGIEEALRHLAGV